MLSWMIKIFRVVVVIVSSSKTGLMQFSIRSYPERVILYRVDDILYIINEPSLKRSKFWYLNISNYSLNKNLDHRKPDEKPNGKLHIYDLGSNHNTIY